MITDRRYTAVSFDVGYTLIEPLQEAPAIVADLLDELGLAPEPETLRAAYHRAERLFLEDYFRPLNDTWEADEGIRRFYQRYYIQFLTDLGVAEPDEGHAHTIIDRYLAPENWRVYPDVLETLETLHTQGYRLSVASDWGSGLLRILHDLGLSRYLDWALVSGAIGFAKPSPQFYRLVPQRAGVPAQHIVHVGDSYYADVRGARIVGIAPVLLDRAGRAPVVDCPVIHSLSELEPMINQ